MIHHIDAVLKCGPELNVPAIYDWQNCSRHFMILPRVEMGYMKAHQKLVCERQARVSISEPRSSCSHAHVLLMTLRGVGANYNLLSETSMTRQIKDSA